MYDALFFQISISQHQWVARSFANSTRTLNFWHANPIMRVRIFKKWEMGSNICKLAPYRMHLERSKSTYACGCGNQRLTLIILFAARFFHKRTHSPLTISQALALCDQKMPSPFLFTATGQPMAHKSVFVFLLFNIRHTERNFDLIFNVGVLY